MKIDVTTWCAPESLAGNYLANTLEEIGDDKLVEKVNVYIHRFTKRMKALNVLEKDMRVFYLGLLMQKTRKEIQKNVRPTIVATLLENLIAAKYKQEIKKI